MTAKSRRLVLILCFLFFVVASPVVLLYTMGYRWDSGLKLYGTGGLYIASSVSGSKIFVNNKEEKETGFLQNDLFLQSLMPGKYSVLITKDDYWPWSKKLAVKEKLVTEARAFMVPSNPNGKIILRENFSPLESSQYEEILNILNNLKKPLDKKATDAQKDLYYSRLSSNSKEKIWWDPQTNKIWAEWLSDSNSLPYFFCDDKNCSSQLLIYELKTLIKNIDFYPNRKDLIIFAMQNSIYAIEIDGRGGRNIQPVYKGKDPIFTVYSKDNFLYILDDQNLIQINLK
ncbi:MAG: hypothetical protein Athens071424_204 [Parcubacteria group bacterium Athens0714_24]|nr:MAG: hypothetical protein Athens071424_204 [Parcubacteria group bacterium Athens0714_24]